MTTQLNAIDLYSAPEAPRAPANRETTGSTSGDAFARELERAQPQADRSANAGSPRADDAAPSRERSEVSARRDDTSKKTERSKRETARETSRADREAAKPTAADAADEARSTADGDAAEPSNEPTTSTAEPREADASAQLETAAAATTTSDATDTAVTPNLPTALRVELPVGADPAVAPAIAAADGGRTPGRAANDAPPPGSTNDRAATADTRAAAPAGATPASSSHSTAAATEPTAQADEARAQQDQRDQETESAPRRSDREPDATMPSTRQDDAARARGERADFSGLADDTDVRALLAEHAAQQRRVGALGPSDASTDRTRSARAVTQDVVRERAERKSATDGSPQNDRRDDASRTQPASDAAARPAESAAVAHTETPRSPVQPPLRGAELVSGSSTAVSGAAAPTSARAAASPVAASTIAVPLAVPVQAILAQVRAQVRGGAQSIQLRLDPAELGRLTLRFRMEGDQLHVAVRASRPEVVEALRADLSAFADTLRDAGIDLTGLDIDLAAPRDGESGNGFADMLGDSGANAPARDSESSSTRADAPARASKHDGLVDVLA